MHELSVTEAILKVVLDEMERYKAVKVRTVNIKMGEFSAYVPECIEEYFSLLSEDTPAADAKLEFTIERAILKCNSCSKEFEMKYRRLRCPYCRNVNVDIISGKGFSVESLEIETEEG